MAEWLKGCEICDAALIKCVDEFRAIGMSENAAIKETHKQQFPVLGTELYSVSSIRNRYKYNKGTKKVVQNEQPKTDVEKLFALLDRALKLTKTTIQQEDFKEFQSKLQRVSYIIYSTLTEGEECYEPNRTSDCRG